MQFKHKGNFNLTGLGFLAYDDEKGLSDTNIKTNTGTSTDHSIFTFFNDVSSLVEGTLMQQKDDGLWSGNSLDWIIILKRKALFFIQNIRYASLEMGGVLDYGCNHFWTTLIPSPSDPA